MIDWPVCLAKALIGIALIVMFAVLIGCATRLCHPDDSSCYAASEK